MRCTAIATPMQVPSTVRPVAASTYAHERYRQPCSVFHGDPSCWLCVGRGYLTGNGSAQYHGGRKASAKVHWETAGFQVIHGATGRPVGRPRHDEAKLSPEARRKRKSRPLVEYRERPPVECNLPKECGGPCTRRKRHYHDWKWQERKHHVKFGLTWREAIGLPGLEWNFRIRCLWQFYKATVEGIVPSGRELSCWCPEFDALSALGKGYENGHCQGCEKKYLRRLRGVTNFPIGRRALDLVA